MDFKIYKAELNNKVYIGLSSNFEDRKKSHIFLSKNPKTHFHRAINKYGSENIEWSILRECKSIDEAIYFEIWYIFLYKSFYEGYNKTLGGDGVFGYKHTEASKLKNRNFHLGKTLSKSTKLKMSKSQSLVRKGMKFSDSHRKNLSRSHRRSRGIKFEMIKNNKVIDTFNSIQECVESCKEYKLYKSHISACLLGTRKSHKGFIFRSIS
jgi:group I intron endonuclease